MTFDPGKHKITQADREALRAQFKNEQGDNPDDLKEWVKQFKDAEPKVTFITRVGSALAWVAFSVFGFGILTFLYVIFRVIWTVIKWANAL